MLEANTERSESNPGRSLGISMTYSDCCLEDSTTLIFILSVESNKSAFEINSW